MINQVALDYLQECFSKPPEQKAVGRDPSGYLSLLPPSAVGPHPHCASFYPAHGPYDRGLVAKIAQDPGFSPLEVYAVAMSWGGQRKRWFLSSIEGVSLSVLLKDLREGGLSRDEAFALGREEFRKVPGLGISYLTKVLFFFLPKGDAYILDQWTAKSMDLLAPGTIRLVGDLPAPDTTADEYENFCQRCDELVHLLPGFTTGEEVERALFDHREGDWRRRVKDSFLRKAGEKVSVNVQDSLKVGDLLDEIEKACQDALDAGEDLPRGIVRRNNNQIWFGGDAIAASTIKWYFKVMKSERVIRFGAYSVRNGVPILKRLSEQDRQGALYAAWNQKHSILGVVPISDKETAETLADDVVERLHAFFKRSKELASLAGIPHPCFK